MKNVARILVSALALWLTTLLVGGPGEHGVWIHPINDDTMGVVFTFVVVALIFAIVNVTLGKVIRFVSLPLRIITLGLFSLVINGILLLLVAWISDLIGFGLEAGGFWWAVLASIVLSLITTVVGAVLGLSGSAAKAR